MELTFITELGHSFVVEIDPNMELENVMALLEAESGVPIPEQSLAHEGRELADPKATIAQLGVTGPSAVISFKRKIRNPTGRPMEQDAEMMRLQLLGNPELMRQLQETQPDIAAAAQSDPARFAELIRHTRERQAEAEYAQQREISRLNADPFDVEAQKKIEEAIRQAAVMENMEHALEYAPESFGKVVMLFVPVEVNGTPLKVLVDTGAQMTIMSPSCAEKCGIMRLLDTRFSGLAVGAGAANLLGKIHSTQLKLADLYLPCSIFVMEGKDIDIILGLDMLKAHQATVDLGKGVLRVQGREVPFLPEHEIPQRQTEARDAPYDPRNHSGSQATPAPSSFPGHGNTLGASTPQPSRQQAQASLSGRPRHPEQSIQVLMDLGTTREVAISTLDAAGGNVDVAASLLF